MGVRLKQIALQLYRLGVVVVIAWLIRDVAVRQRTHGDSPITIDEVKGFFPGGARLRPDDSARDGLFVIDRSGGELGYVVRTQPQCHDIIGYCGVTDVLVALDRDWKILGLKVHRSDDTVEHVHDVVTDRKFLKKWNGMAWDTAAELNLKEEGIEGVSGATMTSMAIARSVKARLQMSKDELVARPPLRFGWRDWGIVAVIAVATLLAFGRPAWRHRWRRPYQVLLIVYVGFVAGDLLAQTLGAGWARAGVPWTTAPGLVLLGSAALLLPWATRSPVYCHHLCPHGAAQELIGRMRVKRGLATPPSPATAGLAPGGPPGREFPAGAIRGLEFLPFALIAFVLLVAMLALPFDLAGIEPFDAYAWRSAGVATIAIAVVGLVASYFVPQAYCRFGCPTGAVLNFVRGRGPTDRFSRRDAAAATLVVMAGLLNWSYVPLIVWVKGVP